MGDKHLESERVVIETYLQEHGLETTLNDAVNAVVKARPRDPYVQLGKALLKASDGADAVAAVAAREILGSSGRPALNCQCYQFAQALPKGLLVIPLKVWGYPRNYILNTRIK